MAEPEDVVWEDAPRRRRHRDGGVRVARWVVVTALIGLVAVVLLLLTRPAERGEPLEGVPRELAGRWVTSDPRYVDRVLIIEPERVNLVLEMGPEGRERHPIVAVRGWTEPTGRGYRIRFGASDQEQLMDLSVGEDGTLRLKNPAEVVWTRGASSTGAPTAPN